MTYIDNPTFICGHRKGGTTVLLCLFDNHPQLLTYPADSAFFYRVFPGCETADKEQTIDNLVSYTITQNLRDEMDVVGDHDLFDVDAIAEAYRTYMAPEEHTAKAHLTALMRAYADHCGQDSSAWRGWVEKTTSTEIYATQVAEWFPNARFIHVTRDPRDNWASLKSGWSARYKDQENSLEALLQSLMDRAGLGLRMAKINEQSLGKERYKVIRFEDLVGDADGGMRDLCSFMNVDFHDNLAVPTVNGKLWKGNNFEGMQFAALSGANVGRWHKRTEENEIATIEANLGDVMETLGYGLTCAARDRALAAGDHYKWLNFDGRKIARK